MITISSKNVKFFPNDSDENCIETSDASPGIRKVVLAVIMEDSNGVKKEDTTVGNVELTDGETAQLNVNIQSVKIKNQ